MFFTEDYFDPTPSPHWLCSILGCEYDGYLSCLRCGAGIYGDCDFVDAGIVWAIRLWLERNVFQWIRARRCVVCGKKTGRGPDAAFCCAGCFPDWIPF